MNTEKEKSGIKPFGNVYGEDTTAMLLSAIAYCSLGGDVRATLKKYLPDWELIWQGKKPNDPYYAYVAQRKGLYAVVIRGSVLDFSKEDIWATIRDWSNDFDVCRQVAWGNKTTFAENAPTPPMISHGANDALNHLLKLPGADETDLMTFLLKILSNDSQVWVTGHSLGGALSTVFSMYMYQKLPSKPKYSVITFAGPTVGNTTFATMFNQAFRGNSRRYTNTLDVVPYFAQMADAIGNLYDGSQPFAPKAADVKIDFTNLKNIFSEIGQEIRKSEYKAGNSFYWPVDEQRDLPGKLQQNIYKNDYKAWCKQAGDQHAHDYYLQLMGWTPPAGSTSFTCATKTK